MDLEIGQEVVIESKKKPPRKRKKEVAINSEKPRKRKRKNTVSKVLKGLLMCLYANQFSHMLKWIDMDKRLFEVRLVNKHNKNWKKEDIGLFKHLDSLFEKRVRSKHNYEEKAKGRFKANMAKLSEYIKELSSRKESKSITYKTYEIFNMPKYVELEIEKLRNKSFEEEVKRNIEVSNMDIGESSNLGAIGGNQNNLYEKNEGIRNIPNMNIGESSNLGAIGGNQNNLYEKNGGITKIPIMDNGESSNLGAIEGNQNNFSYDGIIDINIPIMDNGESSNLGAIGGNQNNFSYENNKEDNTNGNILGNEYAILNPVNTSAVDYALTNDLPIFQSIIDYISQNRNFCFGKFGENVNNIKEKNAMMSRTLNKGSVIPFNTFGENSNIQNDLTSGIYSDYSDLSDYDPFFSSDYEGNIEVKSGYIDDSQLPEVECESLSILSLMK